MSDTDHDGKRVVTTDGHRLGWATRGTDDALYVTPDPGLLRGCDSWIAPSWRERDRFRVDDRAVVGVGEATVVLDAGAGDGTAGVVGGEEGDAGDSDAGETDAGTDEHGRLDGSRGDRAGESRAGDGEPSDPGRPR
ncbi:hypothetical protein [Halobaculum lipolyticum]|uniref:Uncharacterized protein n=1 Tax=Halobaculum lipolyticum TaxID=3032001 RepID=A0ABD5WE12_9EURY|nr:hypothetical protein [Halobaculum sp. DT31]